MMNAELNARSHPATSFCILHSSLCISATRFEMNTLNNPLRYRGRGARRSKRGSVLILVVALLVLMALIGTAWVSTARVDRSATIQTVNSTQADLLVLGVENMAKAAIVADASDGTAVRRGDAYSHTDGTASDPYLASRLPAFIDEFVPVWNPAVATVSLGGALLTPYADSAIYLE